MEINPGTAEAPHRQIASQLRNRIVSGAYGPGERLPSIPTIAEQYGVARQTAQRAIDQLRLEGLIITRPGSGTYVRGARRRLRRLARGRYGEVRGYHADLPTRYRQRLIHAGIDQAPQEIAAALGTGSDQLLVARRYLIDDGNTPVELGCSWFRTADAAGTPLERAEAVPQPLYRAVEEFTGRRYGLATDQITARLATREEAEILRIRPDTPVLVLLHTARDTAGTPIEVTQAVWPGPTTTLTDEYRVPEPLPARPDSPDVVLA